jgi:hypothetical protein
LLHTWRCLSPRDLDDLRILFRRYEAASDRIFSDEVFAADLQNVDDASAFLVGTDIGVFATDDEAAVVRLWKSNLGDFDSNELQIDQQGRLFLSEDQRRDPDRGAPLYCFSDSDCQAATFRGAHLEPPPVTRREDREDIRKML